MLLKNICQENIILFKISVFLIQTILISLAIGVSIYTYGNQKPNEILNIWVYLFLIGGYQLTSAIINLFLRSELRVFRKWHLAISLLTSIVIIPLCLGLNQQKFGFLAPLILTTLSVIYLTITIFDKAMEIKK
jgi:hypothetical protein